TLWRMIKFVLSIHLMPIPMELAVRSLGGNFGTLVERSSTMRMRRVLLLVIVRVGLSIRIPLVETCTFLIFSVMGAIILRGILLSRSASSGLWARIIGVNLDFSL